MRKRILRVFIGGVALLILILLVRTAKYWVGVSKDNIETNARQFQGISEDWITTQETTDTISAMLFYSNDCANFLIQFITTNLDFHLGIFFEPVEPSAKSKTA